MGVSYETSNYFDYLSLFIACAHTPPPPDAVPGRLSVVANTNSPYYRTLIDNYIPKGVNDYAGFNIVDDLDSAPYRLVIQIVNADSYVSGYSANMYGGGFNYRTRLEVEANFYNPNNRIVWSWSGWADYGSANKSMKAIAKMVGKQMQKDGLLAPIYYRPDPPPINRYKDIEPAPAFTLPKLKEP
jgi:hypothetical protein